MVQTTSLGAARMTGSVGAAWAPAVSGFPSVPVASSATVVMSGSSWTCVSGGAATETFPVAPSSPRGFAMGEGAVLSLGSKIAGPEEVDGTLIPTGVRVSSSLTTGASSMPSSTIS